MSGGREEIVSVEGTNMQLPRQMPEPQCDISCPSVASQVVDKMPNFSTLSGDSTQKGEVSFEHWTFEAKGVMHSHTEVTLREWIVWFLHGATADLVWYLGLQAPVSEIINKLELVYGTMTSFNILMQNFYKLQKGKTEEVAVYVIKLEEGTECSSTGMPYNVEHEWGSKTLKGSPRWWALQAAVWFHALLVCLYENNVP